MRSATEYAKWGDKLRLPASFLDMIERSLRRRCMPNIERLGVESEVPAHQVREEDVSCFGVERGRERALASAGVTHQGNQLRTFSCTVTASPLST